mmetsp:Transcript_107733/g.285531  ORF Transcript_107733/g.285531 Transcript_107733/m.285531 type:complete len:251 (-) Transcript_107733:155-907(-)
MLIKMPPTGSIHQSLLSRRVSEANSRADALERMSLKLSKANASNETLLFLSYSFFATRHTAIFTRTTTNNIIEAKFVNTMSGPSVQILAGTLPSPKCLEHDDASIAGRSRRCDHLVMDGHAPVVVVVVSVLVVDVHEAALTLLQLFNLVLKHNTDVMALPQRSVSVHAELHLHEELGPEMVRAHDVECRLGVVMLCHLSHGGEKLRVRLFPNQHVDLLPRSHTPRPDDVDADQDAAHGIHPPKLAVEASE